MTTANAPFPNYNGIPYNRSFFASSSTTGITQAQTDARYLQKTTADTATSLETFSGGIITQGLTIASTSNITLANGAGFNPPSNGQQGYITPSAVVVQPSIPWMSNRTYSAFNFLQLSAGIWIVYYNFRLFSSPTITAPYIEAYITNSAYPNLKLATQTMQNQTIGLPVSGQALVAPAFSGSCFISLTSIATINVSLIVSSTSLTSGNSVNLLIGNTSIVGLVPYEVANLYAMRIA